LQRICPAHRLACQAQQSFQAGQRLGNPADACCEETAFVLLKVLAAPRTDERAREFFSTCYQVNPETKQDGVKEAAEMSENPAGL